MSIRPAEHLYSPGFFVILLKYRFAVSQHSIDNSPNPYLSPVKERLHYPNRNSHIRFQNFLFKIVLEQHSVKLKYHKIKLVSAKS